MTGCDLQATATGRALHALEPDEEDRLREHLPHCRSCRRALRQARDVTASLAAAVPQAEPPPHLRIRILATARAEAAAEPPATTPPPVGPAANDPRTAPAAAHPPGSGPAGRPSETRPSGIRPPRPAGSSGTGRSGAGPGRTRRSVALLGVAAAVLGIGLLSARAVLPTESGTRESASGSSDSVSDRARRIVEGAQARDPATRHATLRAADGSTVAVVLDDAGGTRLLPLGLPPAGPDRDYVLWGTGGEAPTAVGTLDTADGVTRPVTGPTGTPFRGYAVSVESAGPVPSQPSNVLASGVVV